jgi:hypothetical protein
MARPGLAGTRASTDTWWNHAVFYQIAPSEPVDFKALSVRLDALRSLGVDSLLLPAPALPPPGSNGAMPNLDDLDNLLRQASAHGMRVVLTIPAPSSAANLSGLARFWLTRGVAGLHLATPAGTSPEDTQAMVQTLRKLASSVAGQRIVISDLDLAPPARADDTSHPSSHHPTRTSRTSGSAAQLQIDSRADRLPTLDAASLRPILTQAVDQPNLLLDLRAPNSPGASPASRSPLANIIATIALVTEPVTLIDSSASLVLEPTPEHSEPAEPSDQAAKPTPAPPPASPPGVYLPYVPYVPPTKPHPAVASTPRPVLTDPLTLWYKQLAALHHDNTTLRFGSKTFLDFDAQNALVWVNRPVKPSVLTPPIVVLCNLSSSPVQLSLNAAMNKLNLHGFFLRALLRSDNGMGAQDLGAVNLPPFGVYIGELRR